jgi:hypothetical protein
MKSRFQIIFENELRIVVEVAANKEHRWIQELNS